MENLVKWLEKTHRHNWILFCMVLGLVNLFAFWRITGEFFVYSLEAWDGTEYNPFFLGLEILLTSLAITRILVAVDIVYLLQIWPITGDLVVLLDARKHREFKFIYIKKNSIIQKIDMQLEDHYVFLDYNDIPVITQLSELHNLNIPAHILLFYYKQKYPWRYKLTYYTVAFLLSAYPLWIIGKCLYILFL